MNLARPPFDDLHVRRAVAFVLDRQALEDAFGGATSGVVTGHLAFDSMEDNALTNYNPYRTADAAARLQAAKKEMAQSKYDSSHSGLCDAAVCAHVAAVALSTKQLPQAMTSIVEQDLAQIGLHLEVTPKHGTDAFKVAGDPTQNPAMFLFWAWLKDYPNGADFFVPLFTRDAIDVGNNFSLVSATPDQLRGWGYTVSSVPSVQDRVDACLPLVGDAQRRCWTSLDQYMMEKVVSVVPFVAETHIQIVPSRLTAYSYDQSICLPALDRIAVAH
jgi:ABC-type transport system substrate-binding protein